MEGKGVVIMRKARHTPFHYWTAVLRQQNCQVPAQGRYTRCRFSEKVWHRDRDPAGQEQTAPSPRHSSRGPGPRPCGSGNAHERYTFGEGIMNHRLRILIAASALLLLLAACGGATPVRTAVP